MEEEMLGNCDDTLMSGILGCCTASKL